MAGSFRGEGRVATPSSRMGRHPSTCSSSVGDRDVRRMSCDQFEFDPPDSEQSLQLALSCPRQHPELETFLAECGASATSGRPPEPGWVRWEMVRDHLRRFAGLELPHVGECREVVLLSDDCDDVELAIAAGASLIWYHLVH